MPSDPQLMTPLAIAAEYVSRGWCVVPVPYRSKSPWLCDWQKLRLTATDLPRFFRGRAQNIGVLLGAPSRWLIDVDLDHAEALHLAEEFLPTTSANFGRTSKPRSHWLYYAAQPVTTRQWRLPDRRVVVELRSTGGQTVFPGSVHASGERIEWDRAGEPAVVDPSALSNSLEALDAEVRRRLGVLVTQAGKGHSREGASAPSTVLKRADAYLAKLPPAIAGQGGHAATFRAACRLVIGFGLDRDQALTLLHRWNESHCQPKWSERELEHKVDDAMKQPGWRGYLLSKSDRKHLVVPASAIARANRHAIEHRRRVRRQAHR